MGKHHNHGKGGFEHGHDTLKVTVTYEGHPQAIDDAIHGPTRETEWVKNELEQADATIADLADVNDHLMADLFIVTLTAEGLALDLAAERNRNSILAEEARAAERRYQSENQEKWRESDRAYAAERRESDLRSKFTSEVAAKDRTIAKLQTALSALGLGEFTPEDVAAFVASRKLSNPALDISKPKANPDFVSYTNVNYPFALLMGDKEDVRKQVLDCFVDDPERRQKIQAIKNLRERSGLGLKEAKDLVEWACGSGEYAGR